MQPPAQGDHLRLPFRHFKFSPGCSSNGQNFYTMVIIVQHYDKTFAQHTTILYDDELFFPSQIYTIVILCKKNERQQADFFTVVCCQKNIKACPIFPSIA